MPIMPRLQGRPTKIAYAVNGVPMNIASKRTPREREIDHRLVYVNAYRIK